VTDDQQSGHDQAFLVLNPDDHGRRAADVTQAAQPLYLRAGREAAAG
jgi:hypothetical protein